MADEDRYEVLEKIGQGSFGIIRKVRRARDGYVCCRKEISYTRMSQKEKEQLQAELSILKELRHPNIVAYIDRIHLKASHDLHVYMEYCGNGDLGQVIKKLKAKKQYADEAFVWSIFAQIISALYRCHYGQDPPEAGPNAMGLGNDAKPLKATQKQPMILHRDLKPENIFLGADNSVKLGDFGLSKILQSHDFASTYVGTPYYMSPEICMSEKYTLQSDIWALGCIMFELCTGKPPFDATTHYNLIDKIRKEPAPDIPTLYSPELARVIKHCLQKRWDDRPDTASLLNLPAVKLMRKEQEVVHLGQQLRKDREMAKQMMREATEKLAATDKEREAMKISIDHSVRREWEVKARLEIDRQIQMELEKLRKTFEAEVARRVEEEVELRMRTMRSQNSVEPVRSSTPEVEVHEPYASMSTLNEPSEFPSTTDISSLSLESPAATKPKASTPSKRPARQPLARAYTTAGNDFVAASPMDIQMADPSPLPSLAGLSLSPRRAEAAAGPRERRNIFAAAAERWEPMNAASSQPGSPSSPTAGAFADIDSDADEDDDLPALPSPTRARSANSSRNKEQIDNDPFKVLNSNAVPNLQPTARRTQLKPLQHRLASAPNLARLAATNNNGTAGPRTRPTNTVPIVATSPSRRKSKPIDNIARSYSDTGSPVRRGAAAAGAEERTGLPSKKGNHALLRAATRNNLLQPRTLVELAQARGGAPGAMFESEDKKKSAGTINREIQFAAGVAGVAQWDPENPDCPSPFLKKRSGGAVGERFR